MGRARIVLGKKRAPALAESAKIALKMLEEHPTWGNRTIAKKMVEENPGLGGVDGMRSVVRYYRGSVGKRNRKMMMDRGFAIPESCMEVWIPYVIPRIYTSALLIADLHIPEHDKSAVKAAIDAGVKARVKCVIINGDLFDFYHMSRFAKDPRRLSISEEIQRVREFLAYVRYRFKKVGIKIKIIFKFGNHDEWFERYCFDHPELMGIDKFNVPDQIGATENDITIVGDQRLMRWGSLLIAHGHEWGRAFSNSPVNAARTAFMKAKTHIIVGHHHQVSAHSEPDANDKIVGAWSIGCLSNLHPKYSRMNRYAHGYALLTKDENGGFEVRNFKIIKGKSYAS